MEHPKCKTCGERHRLGPCPAYEGSVKPQKSSEGIAEGREAAAGLPVAIPSSRRNERSLDRIDANPKGGDVAAHTRQAPVGVEPHPSETTKPVRSKKEKSTAALITRLAGQVKRASEIPDEPLPRRRGRPSLNLTKEERVERDRTLANARQSKRRKAKKKPKETS